MGEMPGDTIMSTHRLNFRSCFWTTLAGIVLSVIVWVSAFAGHGIIDKNHVWWSIALTIIIGPVVALVVDRLNQEKKGE